MKEFKKNNRIQRTTVALAIATALSSSAVMAEEKAEANADIEVIQVKGIAGGLAESARQKRFDSRIVDAIVAEDIGKLPDNNIAEALQRITGVSISSDFGVGESVTIRGISENRVELNGRSTSGTGRGGVGLDDFPSSFLKTVEIVKSPTPEMIEGALGGTVNMKTVRPLELQEPLVAVTLDAEYADKTENVAPNFTAAVGQNWDLGDSGSFGASAVFSYLDRTIRQDEFQTRMLRKTSLAGFNEDLLGANNTIQVRGENTVRIKEESRERTAFGLSFQWAPADVDANIYLDLSGSSLSGGQLAYDFLDVGGTLTANADTNQSSTGQLMNYDLVGAFAIPKTESDFAENNSTSHALGGEWQINDQLKISGEIAVTSSNEDGVNSQLNLRPVNEALYDAAYALDSTVDPGGSGVRTNFDATVVNESGKVSSVVYSDATALTDLKKMAIREMYYDTFVTDNDETAMRFDVEYADFGVDWISKVKAGFRLTDREYEYKTAELQNENGSTFGDAYKKAIVDGTSNKVDQTFLYEFDGITIVEHDNLFDQAGTVGPNYLMNGVAAYDAKLLRDDAEGTFKKFQELFVGTNYATTGSLADNVHAQDEEWKSINESTSAAYAQFHLDFDDVTAIVGGRFVQTKLESSYIGDETDDNVDNATVITRENDYTDFLPSLNVTYNVADDTLLRFAAAKVMRRADFSSLSPSLTIGNTLLNGSKGAYELDPKRVTQYDFSVEHYFGEGGLVSAAVFYKDVKSFTVPSNSCVADNATVVEQQLTQWSGACILEVAGQDRAEIVSVSSDDYPVDADGLAYVTGLRDQGLTGINITSEVNGGSGEVRGLELALQQQLNFLPGALSGLGYAVNYTFADSSQPNGLPLENISENSFNFQAYWEFEGMQLRAAYNWRDRFLDDEDVGKRTWEAGIAGFASLNRDDFDEANYDPTAGNSYREARGQLDLSASYDVNENITVVANAVNVTGEPLVFTTAQGHDWRLTEADRRFTVGVRAKF